MCISGFLSRQLRIPDCKLEDASYYVSNITYFYQLTRQICKVQVQVVLEKAGVKYRLIETLKCKEFVL